MKQKQVKYVAIYLATLWTVTSGCTEKDSTSSSVPATESIPLVTGHAIDSHIATSQPVGNITVNLCLSPDGKYAISTDTGYQQSLWSIRTADGVGVSHIDFPRPGGLYYGLAFGADRTVYAAQGNHDSIAVLKLDADGTLSRERTLQTQPGDFPSGLALDGRDLLYVANNDAASRSGLEPPTPGSVTIYEAKTGKPLGRYAFSDSFGGSPNFPLAVAVRRDGLRLYVGSERDSAVYVLDTSDPAHPRLLRSLPTGSHPIGLLLDKAEARLFVANAHSDTISEIDTRTDAITQTILLRPAIARDIPGVTPTGLALSPDESSLYVTLGDMNAVAVVDIRERKLRGYMPAGWYPTAIVACTDGKHVLVANAKGTRARYPNPPAGTSFFYSPAALLVGDVVSLPIPTQTDLDAQTQRVLELNRLTPSHLRPVKPAAKIRHVIYVVKENRTYDQVLGDLPQGNGDANRCIFGRAVTPNQHALAERFVLLDNFYDCGEVSGDGWNWSTQAQANEYIIRNVPYSYSGRGRIYDYEAQVNRYPTGGFPANGPDGKPLSRDPHFKAGAQPIPDVGESPGGHLWDLALKAKITYRNYGFFYTEGVGNGNKTVIPDNYPAAIGLQPAGRDLEGISDIDFRRFDTSYADSDGRRRYADEAHDDQYLCPRRVYGQHAAPSRFSEWNREFQQMLNKAADGSAAPALMTIRFMADHTMGASPNVHSPRSMVADNDYAVGQLVEAVSHSPIWPSTAIFIIEDDAQNGPDHVDAHRSTCYVVSPWIRAHSIDHTFQNTVSVLRTMELLLGLPPMCQYDATANPINDWDDRPSNTAPYAPILPDRAILREVNPGARADRHLSPGQKWMMDESARMDFTHADRAPAERLNEIIWKTVRGDQSRMPPTPHGPTFHAAGQPPDHDDD